MKFSSNKEQKQKDSDMINSVFNKNSINIIEPNHLLDKNFRPKCDSCELLCDFEWYVKKQKTVKSDVALICLNCYENKITKDLQNEFEMANFYNIINQNECILLIYSAFHHLLKEKCDLDNWSTDMKIKLIEAIEKHGENWDEILKVKLTLE